jgi:phage terminase large subunit
MLARVGTYFYFFPTYAQAKKVIWDGIDGSGFRFLNHFPPELVANKNETEMKITLNQGSIFQLIGTDNMDHVVGTNPVGCVFSEYALMNPRAWDLVRPILRENGGWALFIYTPRGKNHGFRLWEDVKQNPDWFTQKLTIRDTGVLTDLDMQAERLEGMDEDLLQQEYFCSFSGNVQGSYYARQIDALYATVDKDGNPQPRITKVPWDPALPVHTWWDIGIGDSTAIWFMQAYGQEIRLIDYLEKSGEGLPYYVRELKAKPYVYGDHVMPHDISVREFTSGVARIETAQKLGLRPIRVAQKLPLEDGIDAVRRLLPRCWFDADKCHRGLDALQQYHKEWDEGRQEYSRTPEHDWSSHGADAFRTGAVGWRPTPAEAVVTQADISFDPFAYDLASSTDYDPFRS